MSKNMTFHLNKDTGVINRCHADKRACPLGGADVHFENIQEARAGYEKSMSASTIPTGQAKDMNLAELNREVKTTTDPKVFEAALEKGSPRTLTNLSTNPNTPSEVLVKARDILIDQAQSDRMVMHPNYPLREMSGREFDLVAARAKEKGAWSQESKSLWSNPEINDSHLDRTENVPSDVFMNDNQISPNKFAEVSEKSVNSMALALRNGKYPIDRIPNLRHDQLPQLYNLKNHKAGTHDPAVLSEYSKWVEKNKNSEDRSVQQKLQYTARDVALSDDANEETLTRLANSGHGGEYVWANKNTPAAIKAKLEKSDEGVASLAKVNSLNDKYGGGTALRDELTKGSLSDAGSSHNRGYHRTRAQFDVAKVKELGLNRRDIMTMMKSSIGQSGSYNEATGEFESVIDSGD